MVEGKLMSISTSCNVRIRSALEDAIQEYRYVIHILFYTVRPLQSVEKLVANLKNI